MYGIGVIPIIEEPYVTFFRTKIDAVMFAYEHQDERPYAYESEDAAWLRKGFKLMKVLEQQVSYCDEHKSDDESWTIMMHNIEKVAHRYDKDPCEIDDAIRSRLLRVWYMNKIDESLAQ